VNGAFSSTKPVIATSARAVSVGMIAVAYVTKVTPVSCVAHVLRVLVGKVILTDVVSVIQPPHGVSF
jgi:hypothetical protein